MGSYETPGGEWAQKKEQAGAKLKARAIFYLKRRVRELEDRQADHVRMAERSTSYTDRQSREDEGAKCKHELETLRETLDFIRDNMPENA
jgi:hypothetical protein